MNKINIIKTVTVLTVVTLALTLTIAASDWSQFQKDDVSIGRTADSAPITAPDGTISWASHTAHGGWTGIDTVPVVGDGKVYVVAYNGNVYAKYLNGTQAWTNTTIGGDGYFELATPAYNDGVLYVALSKGNASTQTGIHALHTDNGTVKWSNASIGDQQTNTPVTYYDGLIFFGTVNMTSVNNSDKGYYYCYYANNGTQKWVRNNNNTGGGYYWAGAAVIGDYLVYGDDGGYLTSVYWCNKTDVDELHVGSGKIRSSIAWNVSASDSNYGHIFFTNRSGNRVTRIGFDKSTGEFNSSDWWAHDIGYTTSTPVVYKGRVYVGSSGGLYCLDESDGSEDWSFTPNGGVQSSPVISTWYDNGTNNEIYIYFTTNCASGKLYCLKDYSGNTAAREQWNYLPSGDNAGYTLQGAAISGGWVFFGNDKGYLFGLSNWTRYDFDVRAGTDKWAFKDEVSDNPPDGNGVPDEEFSSSNPDEYCYIEADDEDEQIDDSDSNGNYAAHRFNFTISEDLDDISEINVTWHGRGWHDSNPGSTYDGAYLYIWNGSGYEELANNSGDGDWVYLTGVNATAASNYVNGGNVTVLVVQKSPQTRSKHSHIETDYVRLVVTP
jgi:outer membrane protein assembly factor BamB